MLKLYRAFLFGILCTCFAASARDYLLEFKGAGFFPTDDCFKAIYGKSGGLYGPELTFQLCENGEHWYGFGSVDFFSKKGCSIGLHTPTEASLLALGLGVKYMMPFCYGDFYVGLGFQPVRLKTENCSESVLQQTSKWGFGGIAKIGSFFDLSCNFFLDVFVDYSFVKVGCQQNCSTNENFVTPLKADISGAIAGIGLGYRF